MTKNMITGIFCLTLAGLASSLHADDRVPATFSKLRVHQLKSIWKADQ